LNQTKITFLCTEQLDSSASSLRHNHLFCFFRSFKRAQLPSLFCPPPLRQGPELLVSLHRFPLFLSRTRVHDTAAQVSPARTNRPLCSAAWKTTVLMRHCNSGAQLPRSLAAFCVCLFVLHSGSNRFTEHQEHETQ